VNSFLFRFVKYISVVDQNIYLEYIDSYIYLDMPVTKKRGVNRRQKKGKGKGRGKTMKVMIIAAVPCPPAMIKKMRGGKGGMRGGMRGGAWPFSDAATTTPPPTNTLPTNTPPTTPTVKEPRKSTDFMCILPSFIKPSDCPPPEPPAAAPIPNSPQ
jgi:hypothetical protein